jgi:hypothetical protein
MTDFHPEDFAHLHSLLTKAIERQPETAFRALLSNNQSIILAALERAERAPAVLISLKAMVKWFGDYPEFIPHPDREDCITDIESARAAITAFEATP